MKKLKKILMSVWILLVIMIATSCSSGNKMKTFINIIWGKDVTITYIYDEKKDKILNQTIEVVRKYNITPDTVKKKDYIESKEDAKANFEKYKKRFEEIKGIKYSIDYQDDRMISKLEVDYKDFDYGGEDFIPEMMYVNNSKSTITGMEKTEEMLKFYNFTEKK